MTITFLVCLLMCLLSLLKSFYHGSGSCKVEKIKASGRRSGGWNSLDKEFQAEHRGKLGVFLQGLGLSHKNFSKRKNVQYL